MEQDPRHPADFRSTTCILNAYEIVTLLVFFSLSNNTSDRSQPKRQWRETGKNRTQSKRRRKNKNRTRTDQSRKRHRERTEVGLVCRLKAREGYNGRWPEGIVMHAGKEDLKTNKNSRFQRKINQGREQREPRSRASLHVVHRAKKICPCRYCKINKEIIAPNHPVCHSEFDIPIISIFCCKISPRFYYC
jgi:hypothetical protein